MGITADRSSSSKSRNVRSRISPRVMTMLTFILMQDIATSDRRRRLWIYAFKHRHFLDLTSGFPSLLRSAIMFPAVASVVGSTVIAMTLAARFIISRSRSRAGWIAFIHG
uniref:Uncharacterized protein n=1 Tax=Salmonella sp. TaxID=599 RepID=A0A482EVM2_SALSP|nr:hypothetical protein NNIBIDOC_00153 [Salmonella sp.]